MTAREITMTAPHRSERRRPERLAAKSAHQDYEERELHEGLTADDVAALLKVSRSWVMGAHALTRVRRGAERLPHQDLQIQAL